MLKKVLDLFYKTFAKSRFFKETTVISGDADWKLRIAAIYISHGWVSVKYHSLAPFIAYDVKDRTAYNLRARAEIQYQWLHTKQYNDEISKYYWRSLDLEGGRIDDSGLQEIKRNLVVEFFGARINILRIILVSARSYFHFQRVSEPFFVRKLGFL